MFRMINYWPLGLLVGFLAGHRIWLSETRLNFLTGVYHYPEVAESLPHSTIETAFVNWVDPIAPQQIAQVLQRAKQRRSLPLITLEPFADPALPNGNQTLVNDVIRGLYQHHLRASLAELCRLDQSVLLRFAHEMDHTGQYPWSVEKGPEYVRLYRSVWSTAQASGCRRLHWVWSPAANGDPRQFWPGGDAVDLIGVSVYTSPRWNKNGKLSSFKDMYEHRRWLFNLYQKPILIAEMGVSGELEQRKTWLIEARSALKHYPELIGWVYFSAPQPRWIPLPTGHEDWSLPLPELQLVSKPL
jgi:endoglucanase